MKVNQINDDYRKWCVKSGAVRNKNGREIWHASRANMPIKTCGYYTKNGYWYASCTDSLSAKNDYCGKCGGETFVIVIQTTEQKLEAMTKERDDLFTAVAAEKVCEWKWVKDLDSLTYAGFWMGACGYDDDRLGVDDGGELNFCGGCSGRVTIKTESTGVKNSNDGMAWAEGLIEQLPPLHQGAGSWLIHYGTNANSAQLRDAAIDADPRKSFVFNPKSERFDLVMAGDKLKPKITTEQKLEAAQKHLVELATHIQILKLRYPKTALIDNAARYIRENGLDK